MGRPSKKGLDYFPKDTSYYDDFKIIELLERHGPLGQTIYDVILCMVYRDGYYLEIDPNKLATSVVRVIGNRWVKKDFVLQVICSCADIGLLHDDLLRQGIITSAGLQRRYANVTVRNKIHKNKYWLLDENLEEVDKKRKNRSQALLSAPFNRVSVTETPISVTETPISVAEMTTKEKENKQKGREENKTINRSLLSSKQEGVLAIAEYCGFDMTHYTSDILTQLCEEYSCKWVHEALKEAAENGKRNIGYVKGILKNWQTAGDIERGGKKTPKDDFDEL